MFVSNMLMGKFFDEVYEILKDKKSTALAANYIAADLAGLASGEAFEVDPSSFAELIKMVSAGDISSRGAKDILKIVFENGGDPRTVAEKEGLLQKSDEELEAMAPPELLIVPEKTKAKRNKAKPFGFH